MNTMKKILRWFLIIIMSFLLVFIGGVIFAKVVIPMTSWLWYREYPDGSWRIHGRGLLFFVGLLLFSMAGILAGVTRLVDWALFPSSTKERK
jgi:hypothetical protein